MFRASYLLLVAAFATPSFALQRAFVATYGNDANAASGCLIGNPCRGFQAAHNVVDPGGEVIALDTGGFAALIITKNVSIVASPGAYAGISVPTGYGVTIATANLNVVLRGLTINGVGGSSGIQMTGAGSRVSVENCVVSRFNNAGIEINGALYVRILNTMVRDNVSDAIQVRNGAWLEIAGSHLLGSLESGGLTATNTLTGVKTFVSIVDSVVSGNPVGVFVSASNGQTRLTATRVDSSGNSDAGFIASTNGAAGIATLTVGYSTASGNGRGLWNFGGPGTATLESLGNNIVRHNIFDTEGTITTIAGT